MPPGVTEARMSMPPHALRSDQPTPISSFLPFLATFSPLALHEMNLEGPTGAGREGGKNASPGGHGRAM